MGFCKLRIFPWTSLTPGNDGYPAYNQNPIKFQDTTSSEELDNIDIKITPVYKTKKLEADDKVEEKKVITGYNIEISVYDIQATTARTLFGYTADSNSNTIEEVNGTSIKKSGVFFQGETSKDIKYQKYIYDVEFDEPEFAAETDTKENTPSVKLTGRIGLITETTGKQVKAATVYSGNTGWVTGEPTTMYKRVAPANT